MDMASSVIVELVSPLDHLDPADGAALMRGVNRCMIGREMLQFGDVEPLGGRRFRLSRLMRGLNGSEWAAGRHLAGETFVLLDERNMLAIEAGASARGRELTIRAIGRADEHPVEARLAVMGVAMTPLSPVHIRGEEAPNGDLQMSWVRRSRMGLRWLDGAEVPVGEEVERYAIAIRYGETILRTVEGSSPLWTYPAADRASDLARSSGRPLVFRVAQIGNWGAGQPGDCTIS